MCSKRNGKAAVAGSQPCLIGLETWEVNVARRLPDAQWVSVHPVIIPAVMRDKMHAFMSSMGITS